MGSRAYFLHLIDEKAMVTKTTKKNQFAKEWIDSKPSATIQSEDRRFLLLLKKNFHWMKHKEIFPLVGSIIRVRGFGQVCQTVGYLILIKGRLLAVGLVDEWNDFVAKKRKKGLRWS